MSQLQVATFPWDPKQDPQQQIVNPPTLPSNAAIYQPTIAPPGQPIYAPPPPQQQNGRYIKTEPGLDSPTNGQPYPQGPILPPTATPAQQRAAMNLQQNYGPRAAASINAIQGNMPPQQQQQAQPSILQMQQQQQQAYNQQIQAQMQHQQRAVATAGTMQPQPQQRQPMTQEQYRACHGTTSSTGTTSDPGPE